MRCLAVIIVCSLLSGCSNKPTDVDELQSWDNQTKAWAIKQLGAPSSQVIVDADVPDFCTAQTVAIKIQERHPGYADKVEHLHWDKGEYRYDAYLISINNEWVIIDAVKWQKDVRF